MSDFVLNTSIPFCIMNMGYAEEPARCSGSPSKGWQKRHYCSPKMNKIFYWNRTVLFCLCPKKESRLLTTEIIPY